MGGRWWGCRPERGNAKIATAKLVSRKLTTSLQFTSWSRWSNTVAFFLKYLRQIGSGDSLRWVSASLMAAGNISSSIDIAMYIVSHFWWLSTSLLLSWADRVATYGHYLLELSCWGHVVSVSCHCYPSQLPLHTHNIVTRLIPLLYWLLQHQRIDWDSFLSVVIMTIGTEWVNVNLYLLQHWVYSSLISSMSIDYQINHLLSGVGSYTYVWCIVVGVCSAFGSSH